MTDSAMDWSDLASSDLPSLGTSIGVASPHRNLAQLQVAGQSLLRGGNDSAPFFVAEAAVKTGETAATQDNISVYSSALPTSGRPFESLEDAIRRQEQESLSKIIQRFNDETRKSTNEAIERQLQAAWEGDRAIWFQKLVGQRYVGGKGAADPSRIMPSQSSVTAPLALVAPSPFRSAQGPTTQPFALAAPSDSFKLNLALVKAHWKVVQDSMSMNHLADGTVLMEHFTRIIDTVCSPDEIKSPPMLSYVNAWHLVGNLIRAPRSPVPQAMATLAHLCAQFQGAVATRVHEATLAGQDTANSYNNDVAGLCSAFARLTVGHADPWVVVYFCLRCGDAFAAVEALQQTSADQSVKRIVHTMAQAQGNGTVSLWQCSSNWIARVDPSDRRVVADLLESAKRVDDSVSTKIFQIGTYMLLSGSNSQPLTSETVVGFSTIEDYLTQSLWKAVLQSSAVDELIGLGELILKCGPSHFDDPLSGGWSYALPLLASQQYQKALMWLVEAGGRLGLLQATHLGLVLSKCGVIIRNLGETDSPADGTIADLIAAYARDLLQDTETGTLASLSYLVHIPSEVRLRKEVAILIDTTRDIAGLGGTLTSEGKRDGGAIAQYFSPSEISLILTEAANLLSKTKDDRQKMQGAVLCLVLAERFFEALSLMNQLLSPAHEQDDNRQFWMGEVASFRKEFIDKRSHISDVLQRENLDFQIETNRRIYDLNLLFDLIRQDNFDNNCREVVQSLDLLPVSENDRIIKDTQFRDLDPLIKQVFPYLLVTAMKILVNDHTRLKHELRMGATGTVRRELEGLQRKARLYTSFAASAGISGEHFGTLTSLEALMV
jgi:Nup93/Nic96